ncbi:MAG: Glycosyl transferase family 2 [Candidatus Magasanikbacteria bacterium GW2011_GWA2_37_8]|uniref:Glycosyl transferase family 2 n=1 Tax=Candidatus Magasanikbacteria bacterium GW2011_GWA2_37_8 TaxID=1619036 RepID=A0A0G0HB77_9BACT|nr:MAG: Glycosyl transferase family 2 [Candidatus Magasanikbacteria bacterium GW2011_GWA2_37_8]
MSKVAIVYLIWSNEPVKYLERALQSVVAQTYSKTDTQLLVIYNSHKPDEANQLPLVQELVEKYRAELPLVTVLPQVTNLGFSGANNVGMQWAIDNGFDYVFLHNADGYLAPAAIEKIVGAMDNDKTIGQAQALTLLHPETHLINTIGNNLHYLNIGSCGKFRQPIAKQNLAEVYDVGYVSGAATMMRIDLLKKYGLWHEEFFLYHEDTEYSLRLKIRGFRTVAVRDAVFYHEYNFSKNVQKFFWIERNRHVLKYLFYYWPTIILMFPLEVLYNLGLLLIALKNGWVKELFKVYHYWLQPTNWQTWKKLRKKNLEERLLSDRAMTNLAEHTVEMADMVVPTPIKLLADMVFTIYYYLLKILVWW